MALVEVVITAWDALILIGLALFIAVGLEPAVSWLVRHHFPRWAAVAAVCVGVVLGGFIAAAIPPLAAQTTALVAQAPMYLQSLIDRNSVIGASTNASFLARVGPPMRIDTDDDHDDLRSRSGTVDDMPTSSTVGR